jgi:competence protein ComFC
LKSTQDRLQIKTLFTDLRDGLLDLVYPPKCLLCDEMQPMYFCDECKAKIVEIHPPTCYRCGYPLTESYCTECRGVEFNFDCAAAFGAYDGTLKDAIHLLKYTGHKVMGPVLGALLSRHLSKDHRRQLDGASCIIPMPIHATRLRERGFNQSDLIAREMAGTLGKALLTGVLARTKATKPQVSLAEAQRHANVQNAFEVKNPKAVQGRIIILVDDVLTTGSTADAAAKALREAGAREIRVVTLARSI